MEILKPTFDIIHAQRTQTGASEEPKRVAFCRRTSFLSDPHLRPTANDEGEEVILDTEDGPLLVTSKLNSRQRMRQRVKERQRPASSEPNEDGNAETSRPAKRQRLLNDGEKEEWEYHQSIEPLLIEAYDELRERLEAEPDLLVSGELEALGKAVEDIEFAWRTLTAAVLAQKRDLNAVQTPLDSLSTPIPVKDLVGAPFTNTLNDTLLLDLTEINGTISNSILIPSNSTFLVSDLSDPALPAFFRSSPRTFDLVVLDPPWPNRSAERKATYDLVPDIVQIWANLAFLKDVVSKDGVIGIWCTNRAAHRTAAERFLKDMGFEVAEEWIWGKVTTKGEWSVPLEGGVGNGRRPYEVMLVGRQKAAEMRTVTRKVVFAVPELEHSRKPGGWNNLLTEHVFDVIEPSERMCAELFARELRSGWWSWGNECLKFQDLRYWDEVGDEEAGFVG